jgi:hypothetical protein
MTESLQRKIVSLEQYAGHAGTGHQDAGRILTTVGRLASQRLSTLIADTIERADNALFERAEKAESAFLQTCYYDAMRALRSGCETLEQEFSGRIATAVCQGVPRATVLDDPATDTGAPELEFLAAESDQVEVRLAIQGMVSKLRSSCQQNLYALDKRLGLLMGDPALQRTQNPLAPEVICGALRAAANRIDAGLEVRLLILKVFDQQVAPCVDNLYSDVNQYLSNLGVLPALRAEPRTAHRGVLLELPFKSDHAIFVDVVDTHLLPAADSVPMAPGISPCFGEMAQIPDAASVPMAKGIESCCGQRQQLPEASAVPMAPGIQPSSGPGNSTRAKAERPKGPEQEARAGAVALPTADLRATASRPSSDSGAGDILDLVSLLFNHILEDRDIPGCVRALVGRLQSTILKVALVDAGFFSDQHHPARVLLNRLATAAPEAGGGLAPDAPLYRVMEHIIDEVQVRFDGDMRLFGELTASLNEYLQDAEREVTRRTAHSTELNTTADTPAAREAASASESTPLPQSGDDLGLVRNFLDTHWRRLLLAISTRDGKDSAAWAEAVATMDDLISSVDVQQSPEQRERLARTRPELVRRLRAGMERVSVPTSEQAEFLARLAQTLSSPVTAEERCEQPAQTGCDRPDAPRDNPPSRVFQLRKEGHCGEGGYLNTVKRLQPGQWVEFLQPAGTARRAKLSWVSPITGTLLFTDPRGLKAGTYSHDELALLLECSRARLVTAGSVGDRTKAETGCTR